MTKQIEEIENEQGMKIEKIKNVVEQEKMCINNYFN